MSRFYLWGGILLLTLSIISCEKEKKPLDPLSYLVLTQKVSENTVLEHSRTQIVSIKPGNTPDEPTALTLAFSMDAQVPKEASISDRNAYAMRFTLQDSLFRSKRMGGGTFLLKFQKTDKGYSVRNFKKTPSGTTRVPEFIVDSVDTIVNPEIVDVRDGQTGNSILLGSKGVLTTIKPRTYLITILFRNIGGDEWSVDHGYPDENPQTKEPSTIYNKTAWGLKIDFPSAQRKMSKPTYELDKLGTL